MWLIAERNIYMEAMGGKWDSSQLSLVVELAVVVHGPSRHRPNKVSISPDRFSLQPVAVAISYSFSQMIWSPTQPPPGSVLGCPRRIAAEESDQGGSQLWRIWGSRLAGVAGQMEDIRDWKSSSWVSLGQLHWNITVRGSGGQAYLMTWEGRHLLISTILTKACLDYFY